jgi:hypothetical protein
VLVLLDNNVPRGVARALTGHSVAEARERGWAETRNGDLLRNAEEAGFDVLVTADKNIRYQQNLAGRRIAIVVLTQLRWGLVRRRLAEIAAAVNGASPGSFAEVEIPVEG